MVMMAVTGLGVSHRLETRNLGIRHMILIVIGVVGATGLLLAVLHGIEATIWAAAYVWLGALNLPKDAILYSVELDDHAWCFGADAGTALADDGRAGGGQRHAAVRYQHRLHFRGDAAVLVDALRSAHYPPSSTMKSTSRRTNPHAPEFITDGLAANRLRRVAPLKRCFGFSTPARNGTCCRKAIRTTKLWAAARRSDPIADTRRPVATLVC